MFTVVTYLCCYLFAGSLLTVFACKFEGAVFVMLNFLELCPYKTGINILTFADCIHLQQPPPTNPENLAF
jgi:hypothetical protein